MYRSRISAHSCVHSTHRAWLIGVRLALKASLALLLILLSGQQAHAALGARPQAFPPKLIVGVLTSGWSPFEMFQEGRFTGLSVDYLRAVVGPDVEITTKSYSDLNQLLAAACANRVDVLMSIARTPEREHCLSFSVPYFRGSTSVVTRASNAMALQGEAQVQSARVAIERGFALGAVLRERFPRARIDSFTDTLAALRAIKRGDDDAYFGFTPAVRHYLANPEFRDLSIAFEETGQASEMRFAVPAGKSDLRDKLDRGLSVLRPDDEAAIRARWIGGSFEARPASSASNLC